MTTLKVFLAGLPAFLALDALWLGLVARGFYRRELGPLARRVGEEWAPIWWATLPVYLAIVGGIALFVVPKASTPLAALGWGALFGLVLYAVYDFTNYALVANWSLKMALVDLAWGGFACGAAAFLMKHAEAWLK
jgi:uncharacterized membrane protein